MPEVLERKLRAKALAKGLKGERADAYTYGALRNMGWRPEREKRKALGKALRDGVTRARPMGGIRG